MSKLLFGTQFTTLGQVAVEVLVILQVYPLNVSVFPLIYHIFINIHEYVN